jgi:SWI/SNF-related matrix-associated actin-dependent regulator of chromatin subfamily A member 5
MGLGKTLQSISVLIYLQEYQDIDGPHLIVVPKSTLSNWMNEIERWAPTLKAVRFHGSKEERAELTRDVMEPAMRDENRKWNVCVTTYEVCNIDQKVLNKFAWNYLIIDEGMSMVLTCICITTSVCRLPTPLLLIALQLTDSRTRLLPFPRPFERLRPGIVSC